MGVSQVERKGVVMESSREDVTSRKTSVYKDMAGERGWHVQKGASGDRGHSCRRGPMKPERGPRVRSLRAIYTFLKHLDFVLKSLESC